MVDQISDLCGHCGLQGGMLRRFHCVALLELLAALLTMIRTYQHRHHKELQLAARVHVSMCVFVLL